MSKIYTRHLNVSIIFILQTGSFKTITHSRMKENNAVRERKTASIIRQFILFVIHHPFLLQGTMEQTKRN
jgi:hypothetical protein